MSGLRLTEGSVVGSIAPRASVVAGMATALMRAAEANTERRMFLICILGRFD